VLGALVAVVECKTRAEERTQRGVRDPGRTRSLRCRYGGAPGHRGGAQRGDPATAAPRHAAVRRYRRAATQQRPSSSRARPRVRYRERSESSTAAPRHSGCAPVLYSVATGSPRRPTRRRRSASGVRHFGAAACGRPSGKVPRPPCDDDRAHAKNRVTTRLLEPVRALHRSAPLGISSSRMLRSPHVPSDAFISPPRMPIGQFSAFPGIAAAGPRFHLLRS